MNLMPIKKLAVLSPRFGPGICVLCIIVTHKQVSIADTTFILPFLHIRLYYQSPTMPRHCVAAFCSTKSGVG